MLSGHTRVKETGVQWLGKVPAHWVVAPVKRHYLIQLGKMLQPRPNALGDRKVRYLKAKNVQWGDVDFADIDAMYANTDEIDRYGVRVGDLLVCEGGEGGRCAIVTSMDDSSPCIIQNALHRVRVRSKTGETHGCNNYLRYVLTAVSSAGWLRALNDKATIAHFTAEKFGALPVPMPPPLEQSTIVRFLDDATSRIERRIRAKEKLIELLEERKSVTVQLAVTGRIDVRTGRPYAAYKESGLKSLPTVPSHWDVRPAKWHFREVEERSNTGSEELLSVSHITGVTPRSEKTVTMFEAESNVGHKLCKAGDLVVNTMWAWMAALGVARQEGMVSPSYAVYRRNHDSALSSDYAELMLRSTPYRCEYKMRSRGVRPSRLRLYPDEFLRIRLVCPPEQEQVAVMEFVKHEVASVERTCRLVRDGIESLQAYRERLIAEAVTGKIDVRKTGSRAL